MKNKTETWDIEVMKQKKNKTNKTIQLPPTVSPLLKHTYIKVKRRNTNRRETFRLISFPPYKYDRVRNGGYRNWRAFTSRYFLHLGLLVWNTFTGMGFYLKRTKRIATWEEADGVYICIMAMKRLFTRTVSHIP